MVEEAERGWIVVLSDELMLLIFRFVLALNLQTCASYTPPRNVNWKDLLVSCMLACRWWSALARDVSLWRRFCVSRWPGNSSFKNISFP